MFSHIMVGAVDLSVSRSFYDKTLGALGVPRGAMDDRGRVFYATATGVFGITVPINGESATGANGGTIGFLASSPEQVDAWHAAGLAAGGTTCEDPPGIRDGGAGLSLYVAYLRDPVGNKLTAVHRSPD